MGPIMMLVYHCHNTLDAPSRMKVISQMWRTMGQEDKKVVHDTVSFAIII